MRKNKRKKPKIKKISQESLAALLSRAQTNTLTAEDCEAIKGMAETIEFIIENLERKDVQLKRLLKQILGIKTEKSKKVLKGSPQDEAGPDKNPKIDQMDDSPNKESDDKHKGRGRKGADAYTGASQIFIPHQTIKHCGPCPECKNGKVYREKKPGTFIYIEGDPPIKATVYRPEKLRCSSCGAIFQAELPQKLAQISSSDRHYDETAKTMMAIIRYGYGLPLNRLSNLQTNLGIPLAPATAFEKTEECADKIYPSFNELKRQAAQGDIFFNDDTGMKILDVMKEIEKEVEDASGKKIRTGIFTTAIVSMADDRKIVLFFTGRKHAGENFGALLEQRSTGLQPPIQMSDAKNGNTPKDADVVVSYCNTHARRNFVDVAENYPDECAYVLIDVYKEIYKNDAITKDKGMSDEERLKYHQEKSSPIIEGFYDWLNKQIDDRLTEPNSGLGQAILYVLNRWTELTRFLHIPGAALDNNICEQSLKMSICHRNNSLFYKTEHGAYIGDMFMSLIHTCNLNNVNPFDYITQLQRHSSELFKDPSKWLPWTYQATLQDIPCDNGTDINLESAANPARLCY